MYDSWRIESGNVIVKNGDNEKVLTPYQYDDTRYLLMELGQWGDTSIFPFLIKLLR